MLEINFGMSRAHFSGHAGKAENGDDVCLMASTLFYGLIQALRGNGLDVWWEDDDPNEREIRYRLHANRTPDEISARRVLVRGFFDAFRMLSKRYPGNIIVSASGRPQEKRDAQKHETNRIEAETSQEGTQGRSEKGEQEE